MLESFDLKNTIKPQLYLCKPNRQIVAKLNEAIITIHNYKLASLNELEFNIPAQLDFYHQLQTNKNFNKIKDRYLIKLVKGEYIEYYIINQITKNTSDTVENKTVHCFSLPYELADKNIKNYKSSPIDNIAFPVSCTNALNDILSQTLWTIGYIDQMFDVMYRSIEIGSATVLDACNQIASTFIGLIQWDTINKKISVYNPDTFGVNRGLRFSTNKLLKGVEVVSNDDEMVTRLKPFGKDDLTISSVSITGSDYIEDFSYFMNTDYMSSALITAINNYNILLESVRGDFLTYLNNLTTYQTVLTTKQNEMASLNTTMSSILANLDLEQTKTLPVQANIDDLLAQKVAQQTLISAKQVEINNTNISIASVNSQIEILQNQIDVNNPSNFTQAQLDERNYFIIEKEITNTNFTIAQDLYDYAVVEFDKVREPQLSCKIDSANLLEILEEQKNWDKLNLGDICSVYYPKLNISIKAEIIEIDFNYEDASMSLTISNVKMVLSDQQKFINNLYGAISTSTEVNNNKSAWNKITSANNSVQAILENAWDSAKQSLIGGVNNSVVLDSRGLTASSSGNPDRFIRMNNSTLGFTNNGGNTFDLAMDYTGVYAEKLVGKILIGQNLIIDATDSSNNKIVTINNNGMVINGLNLTITPPSTGGNGISLDNADGLVIKKTNGTTNLTNQITLNATTGLKISQNSGTFSSPNWIDKFFLDTNGKLNIIDCIASGSIQADSLSATTKLTVGNINVIDLITNGLEGLLVVGTNVIFGNVKAGTIQDTDGTKTMFDIANGIFRFGTSDTDYKMKFDGTNLHFGSGSIVWDNLDSTSQTNLVGPQGATGATGQQGLPGTNGVDANLLDWVSSWNSTKTLIGSDYVVTPKIFTGTTVGGITGVLMGNVNGFNGLAGYSAGTRTFSIDSSNGNVDITGSFKTRTASNVTMNISGSKITGSNTSVLMSGTDTTYKDYYTIGTATLGDGSKSGIFKSYTYLNDNNTNLDYVMSISKNAIFTKGAQPLIIGGDAENQGLIICANIATVSPKTLTNGSILDVRGKIACTILATTNYGTGTPSGGNSGDIYFQFT